MAEDLNELIAENNFLNPLIIGHSMGGKVAMTFAQKYPKSLEKLIIVDMGIKAYPPHHQHILAGIHALDLTKVTVRSEAEKILKEYIESEGVRQFLLKNLYWKEKGKLAWRMNVEVLKHEMNEILSPLPSIDVFTPTLFIRGELSNYILDEDFDVIEETFHDAELITIPNAGHWVHAENPELFVDTVLGFCLR
jgi:pimeloyl-ACP methyl ester carboxylesterase